MPQARRQQSIVYIPTLVNIALSWRPPVRVDTLFGARLLRDGPKTPSAVLAVTRAVLRTNPQIAPLDALQLADAAVAAARRNDLPPEYFAAMLLQESAFDPRAMSSAGAIGIAQFMPDTAASLGVDPFEPFAAIDASAQLLGAYVRYYRAYANPYTVSLAAYNAGPGAVSTFKGIPPYAETRAYIDDIVERWAKIAGYETRRMRP